MATIGSLTANLKLESAAFIRDMNKASQAVASNTAQMKKSMRAVEDSTRGLEKQVQGISRTFSGMKAGLAALGIGLLARDIVRVGAEFQKLQSSLITVTGSAEAASQAFSQIKSFAASTPFDLQQVTTAFIKLKALGLDPSMAALEAYGNTASAMGKSLNQMIEAVADAATGEFERLKEFGIRAKSEGDRVTFTFQGVATQIGKNSAEIESYLRKIGEVQFGGAMEREAKTLGGALSNLGDAFAVFQNEVAEGGLAGSVANISRGLAEAANGSQNLARQIGAGLGAALKTVSEMAALAGRYLREIGAAIAAIVAYKAATLFAGIAAAVFNLGKALLAARAGMVALTAAFAANPIGLFATAVSLAVAGLILFGDQTHQTNKAVTEAAQTQESLNKFLTEGHLLTREAARAAYDLENASLHSANAQLVEAKAIAVKNLELARTSGTRSDTSRALMFGDAAGISLLADQSRIDAAKNSLDEINAALAQSHDNLKRLRMPKAFADDVVKTETATTAISDAAKKATAAFEKMVRGLAADNVELQLQIAGKHNLIPLMKVEASLREQMGRDLLPKERKAVEDLVKANQALADSYEVQKTTRDLERDIKLSRMSREEAEKYSEVLRLQERLNNDLTNEQIRQVENLVQARQETERWRDGVDDLTNTFQGFFQDVFEKGEFNFGKLWDSIKAQYAAMLAWMATQAIMNPIIVPLASQMFGGANNFGSMLTGAGGGGFGGIGNLLGVGDTLFGGSGGGSLFGGFGNWISSGIDSLGGMLGFGTNLAVPAIPGIGGLAPVSGFNAVSSGSLFGGATLGSALGGFGVGSLIGGMMGGNSMVSGGLGMLGGIGGSMIGALGAFGGPLGMLAGGLIGGALGNFGASNQGAIANIGSSGLSYTMDSRGSAGNKSATDQAAQLITAAAKQLEQAGITLNTSVTGFSLGSDKSYVYYNDGAKDKLGIDPGDVGGMAKYVIERMLYSAQASGEDGQRILANYKDGSGNIDSSRLEQLLADIGFADTLKNISFIDDELTQTEQVLKRINDQFAEIIGRAQDLGLDTSKIIMARDMAIQGLIDDANRVNQLAIDQMTDPVLASWNALMDAQVAREKELRALGADTSLLARRDELERQALLKQLNEEQLNGLNSALMASDKLYAATLQAEISAVRAAEAEVNLAHERERAAELAARAEEERLRNLSAVTRQSEAVIAQLTDTALDDWFELVRSQTELQQEAAQYGVDATLLQRRAELERHDFLKRLSYDQLQSLNSLSDGLVRSAIAASDASRAFEETASALGLSISQTLGESSDVARMAEGLARGWSAANDNLMQTIRSFTWTDPALSPTERYQGARSEFDRLQQLALGGDMQAANDLSGFASQFRDISRNFFGSTTNYGADSDFINNALNSVASYAGNQQSVAQQQVALATQTVDRLDAIREAISEDTSQNAQSLDELKTEVAKLTGQIKNIMAAINRQAA